MKITFHKTMAQAMLQRLHKRRNRVTEDSALLLEHIAQECANGYTHFIFSTKRLAEATGLTPGQVHKAKKRLVAAGIITLKEKSIRGVRYPRYQLTQAFYTLVWEATTWATDENGNPASLSSLYYMVMATQGWNHTGHSKWLQVKTLANSAGQKRTTYKRALASALALGLA